MAAVIHRTTLQYLPSANEPDFPEPTWKWSPDMAAVAAVPQKYWKAPVDWNSAGAGPVEMSSGEKAVVDAAEVTAKRSGAASVVDGTSQISMLMKALAGVIADELSSRVNTVGEASQTWDPASIANGAGLTSPNFTVTGAALGDYVIVSGGVSQNGLIANGYVSAANTVVVRLHNGTGAAVNLTSSTWKVLVLRPVVRTLAQAKAAIQDKLNTGAAD